MNYLKLFYRICDSLICNFVAPNSFNVTNPIFVSQFPLQSENRKPYLERDGEDEN
jgi:hypothetical protein